jgi:hypothetical protein
MYNTSHFKVVKGHCGVWYQESLSVVHILDVRCCFQGFADSHAATLGSGSGTGTGGGQTHSHLIRSNNHT